MAAELVTGKAASRLTGALLITASASLAASALPSAPAWIETAGYVLAGGAVVALVDRGLGRGVLARAGLVLTMLAVADRLAEHGDGVERPWAVPAAMAVFLALRALATTPGRVVRWSVPAAVVAFAALGLRTSVTEAAVLAAVVVPLGALVSLVAVPRVGAARTRAQLDRNQADLDAVVLANLELRNTADAGEAAQRIARIATELLGADGAVVWLQGPGRLLCAGGHGTTPPPERELGDDSLVGRAIASGAVVDGDHEVVIPLTASGGVFGAVTVTHPTRRSATFVTSVLQVFGAQAGYSLERLRAVESLIDARYVDPVTGVGNRHAATATIATLRQGDAVLLLSIEGLHHLRATQGDARADLVLGQAGLHLRAATRAGDLVARFGDDVFLLVLRDLSSTAETIVSRLLESWQDSGTATPLRAGAALHFADSSPLDTLDRATGALEAARFDLRDPIEVAAERATWGPAH